MPYRDETAARLAARERNRRYRERKRQAKATEAVRAAPALAAPPAADPAGELAAWARARLVVPPGHPEAGKPMELPAFAEAFLREGWEAHESALSVARKNAKSAICAVLALWHLAGPRAARGWRGAIASVSKEKAAELRGQVAAIAEASGLPDVRIRRSPYPGVIETDTGSLLTLSADRTAGHAHGFDLVIVDETGLMPERARELLAGLRSSVSAKGGRVLHISVRGDSPLFREILDNPATMAHVYAAPDGCELADRDAWAAANPGLGTIKRVAYMEAEVARIAGGAPGDEPAFRAFDLNQALSPTAELIV
ncbi:MAG: terminase large subunit, partial [Rhodospirillaceae bacterium]|nr:terminase large subunit [Rhodospirillaceae bacterium]